MKKKIIKAIAVLLCIVTAFISMSVSPFAASKEVYKIDKLYGHTVTNIETNKSETFALATLDYGLGYASTTSGGEYKDFNYYVYKPSYCDDIEIYDYVIRDDTFIFLLRAYKLEEFWDYQESEDVYYKYEEYVLKEQFLVTTTDFLSFNKYDLSFSLEEPCVLFECIDGKVIYGIANHFEKNGKAYFEAEYYTSADLLNWTEHKTPAEEATDMYQDVYYSVAGNALCIELYTSEDDMYFSKKVYLTDDFEKYVAVDGGYKADETQLYYFSASPVEGKILRVGDVYSNDEDLYIRTDIVQIDVKTGEEQVLFSESVNFWESYNNTDDGFFFLFEREEGTLAEVFIYNPRTMKFETEKTDYNIMDVIVCGYLNNTSDAVFFLMDEKLCVSPSGNPAHYTEYDISYLKLNLEETYPHIIRLNGQIVYIGTSIEAYHEVTKFSRLDVSLQKKGDLNNDGTVNSTDALQVLMSTVNKATLTAEQKAVADTNKDGFINSTDALMILQYSVGKISGI